MASSRGISTYRAQGRLPDQQPPVEPQHGERANTEVGRGEGQGEVLDLRLPNWYANGHREVFCKCGRRATKKNRKKNGVLSIRVEGACAKCGTINLKCRDRFFSKGFRLIPNTKKMPIGKRDYALGNGLTYHDPVSRTYGRLRHAHGEGYNQIRGQQNCD